MAIECDKNGLDGMRYLAVSQLIIAGLNNSVFCARSSSQVQSFRFPKLLTRQRRMLSIVLRNLRFTRTNGRYRFFENGKAKERTRFAPLSQTGCSKMKIFVWICKS